MPFLATLPIVIMATMRCLIAIFKCVDALTKDEDDIE